MNEKLMNFKMFFLCKMNTKKFLAKEPLHKSNAF